MWGAGPLGAPALLCIRVEPPGGDGDSREDGATPHTPASSSGSCSRCPPGQGACGWKRGACLVHLSQAPISRALCVSVGLGRWAFGGTSVTLAPGGPRSTCSAGLKPGVLDSNPSRCLWPHLPA